MTQGSFDTAGTFNAFVTKLSADGSTLVYSTYLGGSVTDEGQSIAVDASGNAYVTGKTRSVDFPLRDSLQATFPSGAVNSAFITALNPEGTSLLFSTLFGSGEGNHVVVDNFGGVYVTGLTYSSLPVSNPLQPVIAGSSDAFVVKIGSVATPPSPTYKVSGRVANGTSGISGVTVALTGTQAGTAITETWRKLGVVT